MAELVPATYFIEIKKVWIEQISDPEFLVYFYDAVGDPIKLTSKKTKDAISITKTKASYIMNRKPGGNIHQIIIDHVNDDEVNKTIVSYFQDNIVKHIRPLSIPDLLIRLRTIISRDLNVPKETRAYLISLADKDHLAEFLAKTFQYVAPINNVLTDGVATEPEDIVEYNKNNPLPKEEYGETPDASEKKYVDALVEVYGEMDKNPDYSVEVLLKDKKHLDHFKRQRSDYFAAEAVHRGTRDIYGPDEPDQFDILKQETYAGVIDVYEDEDYKNGMARLRAVLQQAAQLPVNQCWLSRDTVWIGVQQKKGVCHFLVNDGMLDGWVKHDEDETV